MPSARRMVDSGLSWIGVIPSEWRVLPTRAALSIRKDEVGVGWERTPLLSLTRQGVILRDVDSGVGKYPASFEGYQFVEPDDLVFCLFDMDETPRTVGRATQHGMVTGAYTRFVVNRELADPRYLEWYYLSIDEGKRFRPLYTGLRKVIQKPRFMAAGVALPPRSEQGAIADYLDRETAKIDALIKEQQRLIEMLRERRLSVITGAMHGDQHPRCSVDSIWYSQLPQHWGHGRVKSVAKRVTDGAHISPDPEGGVFDFVSTRDLRGGQVDFEGALKTSPETYKFMVRTGCRPFAGDVLFSKDGTVGETAVVRENREFAVASSLVIIRPDTTRMGPDFMAYAFASKTAREQAASMMRGAGLPRLSVANLARVEIPIPPLDDQRRIVEYLDEQTAKIDTLIAETERFIELSQERRAALITAAVTGQIDVREQVGEGAAA